MKKAYPSDGNISTKRAVWRIMLLLGLIAMLLIVAGCRSADGVNLAEEKSVNPAVADNGNRPEHSSSNGKLMSTPPADNQAVFPTIPPSIEQRPIPPGAVDELEALFSGTVPIQDYFLVTEELERADLGQRVIPSTTSQLGDRADFFTNEGLREAELIYRDELAAYWVETGLVVDSVALAAAAERLRNSYYPLLVRQFGTEPNPGVDGDPLITILHVLGAPDTFELGYFTDENQYPRTLFDHSNEREMVYLNMAQMAPGPLYDGTLVHELQHLIQWNLDANEDKWLNEGLSQLAETMAGLDTVDPRPYLEQTDIRLDEWDKSPATIYAHYAGSYLYLLYLWEQLGDDAIADLARLPANGLSAVRSVLAGYRPERSLESFTADWATALYLDGESSDPRYQFTHHDLPQPFFANRVRQRPFNEVATLDQYGVDIIDLDFSGPATITFAGDKIAEQMPAPPEVGSFWYTPPANSSRYQLTAAVDLSSLPNATLSFQTWYDLEPQYDFAYLSVSTDEGHTWRLLEPEHSLTGFYGPAWGGRSEELEGHQKGWLDESITLDVYAGQSILLRFDVLTDFEALGRGFALTSPNIPELAEQPVWRPNGFVKVGHLLPQKWEVRLIRDDSGEVLALPLDEQNRVQMTIELGPEGGALIIVPLNPFVTPAANYWLMITD